jgi:hypothetical protein
LSRLPSSSAKACLVASETRVGNHGRITSRSSRPLGFASRRLNSTVRAQMPTREYLLGRINHFSCQLFGLFVNRPPSIRLTSAARSELLREMSAITHYQPVATIMLARTGAVGKSLSEPYWGVTFYDKWTRPSGRITKFEDIPFVFVQDVFTRLNGATLDYSNGRFVVTEAGGQH